MSIEKWSNTLEIEIPNIPGEVTVRIPESVFALFHPRKNGSFLTLGYGPVEPGSPIVSRKIFFRSRDQKPPENAELQSDAQETRYRTKARIYLEKTSAPLNFR